MTEARDKAKAAEHDGHILLLEAILAGNGCGLRPMSPWDRVRWMKNYMPKTWATIAFQSRWATMMPVEDFRR